MMRVGIVGFGGMGRGRLRYYAQIPDADVVAVADVRADELRRDPGLRGTLPHWPEGARWYSSIEGLVAAGGIDVADVCLPSYLHASATTALLDAGIHVLCEKPMALSHAECEAMLAVARRSRCTLMVAHCIRFWPEYEYLAALARSGEAGRLVSARFSREGPLPRGGQGWMCQQEYSGGALLDLHIHDIDYCQHLLGLPKRVYAQNARSNGTPLSHDCLSTSLDYGEDVQVHVLAQWVRPPIPFVARYEASFESAYVSFDSSRTPTLLIYRPGKAEPEHPQFPSFHTAYLNEIRYFLDCVSRGCAPTRCPPEESRNSIALAERIREALSRREVVDTTDIAAGAP